MASPDEEVIPPPPPLPPELAASRSVADEAQAERIRSHIRREENLCEAERKRQAEHEEWLRTRIPVGIVWADPRSIQGMGPPPDDPEERDLLSLIWNHRRNWKE